MKASCSLLAEVELCHLAAVLNKKLSPKKSVPLLVLLGAFIMLPPSGFAQAPNPPLNFGNNFFVTGDYIVAGATGMTTSFTTINGTTYAIGTITVPDSNPGITGTKQVPPGAQIVAALLYWQSVEKVGVTPGSAGSGQNGYFRPLLYSKSGGPAAPGYAIAGTNVSASTNVSWSSGGCSGGSTGKLLRTYRADVAGALPLDANGNPTANTSFEVRLPSAGNSTPLTLGATLVIIYRIPSGAGGPNIPLNSIVIYDGDYSQSGAQLTMTQQMQGFYDAAHNPVSRLTHIVGGGQTNKFQTVYLSSGTNSFVKLPFLYGNRLPAFPGYYGTWDNPTWTFNSSNPISEDSSFVTTQVVPSMSNQGCVSWGAVIVSTTVKNSDNDGILDSWKLSNPPGYCDASINNGVCTTGDSTDPGWVALPGALHGQKDVFLQYDYICSTVNNNGVCNTGGSDYSFDPRLTTDVEDGLSPHADVLDKVVAAYANHGINLHAIPGNPVIENQSNVACSYSDIDANNNPTCPFPNEPGTVGFGEGLAYIKNQTIDTQTGVLGCDPNPLDQNYDVSCVAVFHHGKKDSYHYALFSHGVGLPNWFLSDGSLSKVQQSGKIVTFTTALPHGISQIVANPKGATATDSLCSLGRVTVVFAVTNPNLNGTYCVLKSPAPTATTFSISVGGSSTNFTYTPKTDPGLSVANGQVTSMSGYSDVGGQNSVVSLGYKNWGPPYDLASDGNKWQNKAGTLMHELGHTMGLTHGGTFLNKLGNNDYTPTYEANCKANVQTSMSYLFQFDLLRVPSSVNAKGNPQMVVDYSAEVLPILTESSPAAGILGGALYDNTASFQLTTHAVPGSALALSKVASPSNGSTTYTGTIIGGNNNAFAGKTFVVAGFTNAANNGPFVATASTGTTLTLSNASGVAETHPATATPGVSQHCDGTPLLKSDQAMSYVASSTSTFFWSLATGDDTNFNGTTDVMHGHNEWEGTPAEDGVGPSPGVDLQQVSAAGTITAIGPGGEPGGLKPLGGGGLKPLGGGGGLLFSSGGGGGLKPLGGGGYKPLGGGGYKPLGGGGLSPEVSHEEANSYTRPPSGLTASEGASPRTITLNWFQPTFGQITQYNVYRAIGTGAFSFLASITNPSGAAFPPTSYTDSPPCNPNGYTYKVTAFVANDLTGAPQESVASNIASTGPDPMTGCYNLTNFSSPSNAVQGSIVSISWTVQDDFYTTGNPVNNFAANTLVAIGPGGTRTPLISKGVPTTQATTTFTVSAGRFTFDWDTDPFPSGSYSFELNLDSSQSQSTAASPLQLAIDINDTDSTPHITTLALPGGVVGAAYNSTLTEEGGTPTFKWSFTGSVPVGISQAVQYSPTLSGITCVAGLYNLTATVTDSAAQPNSGTEGFTLNINKASTTTIVGSNANPSAFQQMVTFTVNVAPQYGCMPTGTVTLYDSGVAIASNLALTGGSATFTTSALSVGMHSITATYGGDANFTSSNSGIVPQTVNKASTATSLSSVLPSTVFVGQPVTVTYSFGVVAPGAGSPIPPTGSIVVSASDGSGCMSAAVVGGGICTLSPAPTSAGPVTFNITYSGDGNFLSSGANSNYTVYQLVFTTQPSNAGVGLTITPAVQVSAQDNTNSTLPSFTGSITLAISAGTGTLSGTTAQNAVGGVATFNDLSINRIGNGYTLVASPTGGVPDATSTPFNIDTFYVDGPGNFGTLDLPSGVATQIGAGTVTNSTGLDLTPTLQLYGYDTSGQLMRITPSTGATTPIGSSGTLPNPANTKTGALATGAYFAIDNVDGTLYSIDLATGATTSVGPTAIPNIGTNCGFNSSLAGSATVLYYTIAYTGSSCNSLQPDTLYVVDPTGGTTTPGVATSVTGFVGSAFVNGTLYGFTADGHEYVVDPATGVATLPKNTTANILSAGGS